MKNRKDIQLWATLGIFALIFVAGVITNTAARCSADESAAGKIRVDNLLLKQQDSLWDVFDNRELAIMDSLEDIRYRRSQEMHTENENLKKDLKRERRKSADLEKEFRENPTLENCTETVDQQKVEIAKLYNVTDSLDKEAQNWCELYENENVKGILKDSIISRKTRTISTQQTQLTTLRSEISIVDQKLNDPNALKRNWKWATGSYRDWLRDRDVEKFLKKEAEKKIRRKPKSTDRKRSVK